MEATYRPMQVGDVRVGQKYLMSGDCDYLYKGEIMEVLNPNGQYKAFVDIDGCRYGLQGSYVKIKGKK